MSRSKTYIKNIACLETLWNDNIENRLSVYPILDIASKLRGLKCSYFTCNTVDELKHNLSRISRNKGYGFLYMAFHGKPGELLLDDGSTVSIEELAGFMGRMFRGWVIHLSACSAVDVMHDRIASFIRATGVSIVFGYNDDIYWSEGAALDLLLFDWIQEYKDLPAMWKKFNKTYADLISITGLKAFYL